MADTRKVTISITINLGNYENLRLEVSDTAETKEDADKLRHFLADVLDGYGENDATAKHAIDKYKDRILADAKASFAEEETESAISYTTDLLSEDVEPIIPVGVSDNEVPEEPPATVSAPPVEPAVGSAAEFVCSKCGAPVNKLQKDVSMMFNNKILCKNCMK